MEKKIFVGLIVAIITICISASATAIVRTIENKTKLELFHDDIKEIKSDIKILIRETK